MAEKIILKVNERPITVIQGGGNVASVNGDSGPVVVIDPDDLNDSATTNKFITQSEKDKLASIDATHYLPPVQNAAALSAIAESSISDKARTYVEDSSSDYFYDSSAVSGDIAPDDQTGGTGFWKQVAVGGETPASIKTKYESNPDTNAFTDTEKANVAANTAAVNGLGTASTSDVDDFATGAEGDLAVSALQSGDDISELNNDAGYITSAPVSSVNTKTGVVVIDPDDLDDSGTSNKFMTASEKSKLASIDATHYLPPLQDTTALASIPEANITDKARVYVEDDISDYFYDSAAASGDIAPADQTGGTGFWKQVAVGGETPASIKTKYESNGDTNAFTDSEKTTLGNQSGTNTGDQSLSGTLAVDPNTLGNDIILTPGDKVSADGGKLLFGDLSDWLNGEDVKGLIFDNGTEEMIVGGNLAGSGTAMGYTLKSTLEYSRMFVNLGYAGMRIKKESAPAYDFKLELFTDAQGASIYSNAYPNTRLDGSSSPPRVLYFEGGKLVQSPFPTSIGGETAGSIKTKYESNADTNAFTDSEKTLLGNQSGTNTGDQTPAQIKTAYESNADTNAFTDAEKTLLGNQSGTNTGDQSGAQIKSAYESEANTNAFTDAEKTKLATVEDLFHGRFASLALLNASAAPTLEGVYAYAVVSGETKQFLWDTVNSEWDQDDSATTAETAASIKTKYESNADTNAFTDAEKTKVAAALTEADHDALPSDNPHSVTKSQVGLGSADNTSDADKPVSTAQQTAIDLKANKAGDTYAGAHDMSSADSLSIPTSAAPVVNADGEIATDTTITEMSHGMIKHFAGEELIVISMPVAQVAAFIDDYVPTFNAATKEFEMQPIPSGAGNTTITNINNVRSDSTDGTSSSKGLISGAVDGTNSVFTVSTAEYVSGTLSVWRNGQKMTEGSAEDYRQTNSNTGTFTFNTPPLAGDVLDAIYVQTETLGASLATEKNTITSSATGVILGTTRNQLGNAAAGDITFTLPAGAEIDSIGLSVTKIDFSSNSVILATPGAELINGAATYELTTPNQSCRVIWDGSNYRLIV